MSELEKFVSRIQREPKKGIYEHMLGSLLLQSIKASEPLAKISKICEAAFMLKTKTQIDTKLIDTIFTVNSCLVNTDTRKPPIKIAWSFKENEENYKRYIEPWLKVGLSCIPRYTSMRFEKYPETPEESIWDNWRWSVSVEDAVQLVQMRKEIDEKVRCDIAQLPIHEKTYQATSALTAYGYTCLKTQYVHWALLQLIPIQTTIAEQVNTQVWSEIYQPQLEAEEERDVEDKMDQRQ